MVYWNLQACNWGFRAGIPTFSGYVMRTWIYLLLCCEPSWRLELFGGEVWSWLQLLISGHVGFLVMRPYTGSRLFSQASDSISDEGGKLGGLKLLRLVIDTGASFPFKPYEVLTSFWSHMHILASLCWASQFLDLDTREPSIQNLVEQQELVLKLGTMLCTEMEIDKRQ